MKRVFKHVLLSVPVAFLVLTGWIAYPTGSNRALPQGLTAAAPGSWTHSAYSKDADTLTQAFKSQVYRSFCGPASIATVLRAYGIHDADQKNVFPSVKIKIQTFYSGLTLATLSDVATRAGLSNEIVYADTLSLEDFRERLKSNLTHQGDYVLINYDRSVLGQSGAGHISPIAAYDEARDTFLVLDQAAYKYPYTWIPASLLYKAARTLDGNRYRGLLFIQRYALRKT